MAGHVGMAKPMFGATGYHAACLFAFWGPEKGQGYYRRLKRNQIEMLGGNKQVAVNVSAGKNRVRHRRHRRRLEEVEHGQPVEIGYPDQQPGGMGTMFFPNTLAVIKGWPHPEAARQLVDYLLSPEVEIGAGRQARARRFR